MSVSKLFFAALFAFAVGALPVAAAEQAFRPIDTCYHWLREQYLGVKLQHAKEHNGALYFYGDKAIFCWRSPLGASSSWEDHGDRLIRIKFKPEVAKTIHIHVKGESRADTLPALEASKSPVHYSNLYSFQEYFFAPAAVESWSAYEPRMIEEMRAELEFFRSGQVVANDLFYPFSNFRPERLIPRLADLIDEHVAKSKSLAHVYGAFPERHFETEYELPWRKFIVPARSR